MAAEQATSKGLNRLRDYAFCQADFEQITKMVYAASGIDIPEGKQSLVYSRLSPRLQKLGLSNFQDYCRYLTQPGAIDERRHLLSALTTNTTSFFRENHHFETLSSLVLPDLIKRARSGRRVRIWSAGCSSGEEACSIAMRLLEACPDAISLDLKILATDIDENILARAKSGSYSAQSLGVLPPQLLDRFFDPSQNAAGARTISAPIRKLLCYRYLNLVEPWPVKGPFDLIFCRNVAIYFNAETQARLWQQFLSVLLPGGHLFLGHSERLPQHLKESFELVGTTTYRMRSASSPPSLKPETVWKEGGHVTER